MFARYGRVPRGWRRPPGPERVSPCALRVPQICISRISAQFVRTESPYMYYVREALSGWSGTMKVLLVGLLSALVQFGLAILGWGGFGPFFSHPPLVAMVAV